MLNYRCVCEANTEGSETANSGFGLRSNSSFSGEDLADGLSTSCYGNYLVVVITKISAVNEIHLLVNDPGSNYQGDGDGELEYNQPHTLIGIYEDNEFIYHQRGPYVAFIFFQRLFMLFQYGNGIRCKK